MAKLPEDAAVGEIEKVLDPDAEYGPKVDGKCNARINSGGKGKRRCKMDAGFKTDHPGFGPCTHHFGSTSQVRRGTSKQMYEAEFANSPRFGVIREIDPMSGILQEIGRSNGFIQYLESRINQNVVDGKNENVQLTYTDEGGGERVEPAVLLWKAERVHFARCCKMAGDMGVAAAAIDLARVMGDRLAELLEYVVRDLGHDPDDPRVDNIVRGRLALAYSAPKEIAG
jgi:hypothetical protein